MPALLALALTLSAPARDEDVYYCKLDVPVAGGALKADATIKAAPGEKGVAPYGNLTWNSQYGALSLWMEWNPTAKLRAVLPGAWIGYTDPDGRRKRTIRLEIAASDSSAQPFAVADLVTRRGFVSFHFDWDGFRAYASGVPAAELRAYDARDGSLISSQRIDSATLEAVAARVPAVQADFAAMVEDYENRCDSPKNWIVVT